MDERHEMAGSSPEPDRGAPESDEALATQLAGGNRPAYEELVRRYHRRVRTICSRMCGRPGDVDDLCQETFLRMYKYRETFQAGRRFSSWLDRICTNVCLRARQQRLRRDEGVVSLGEREVPADARPGLGSERLRDPESVARVSELREQVTAALQTLAAPYRAAIVLRVFGELSYQEIAQALDCSIGTVMSRINRARQKLKEQLKDRS